MLNNEQIIVKDACILFDLIDLNLIQDFFRMEFIAYTTQQVIEEITDPYQNKLVLAHIYENRLFVDKESDIQSILNIFNECPGLSLADSSVLELGIRKRAIILSADRRIRNESTRRGLIVRGVLWIIEELYLKGIISREIAIEKLSIYPNINNRVPIIEIQKLITRFTQPSKIILI